MDARQALADAIAAEMDTEITPDILDAIDVVLVRLWLHGFKVVPLAETDIPVANAA
jgi:hypothetical protein